MNMSSPVREKNERDHNESCDICQTTLCDPSDPTHNTIGAFRISTGVYCPSCWEKHRPLFNQPPYEGVK